LRIDTFVFLIIMSNTSPDIKAIRTDYGKHYLLEGEVNKNPLEQFKVWLHEAIRFKVNEPNAMNVSTLNQEGYPTSRIVLLRDIDHEGFTFFTNYNSHKGIEVAHNPKVGLTFFWPELERQVRVCGEIVKVDEKVSDDYFNSRPRQSQLGALVSNQSAVLKDREELERAEKELEKKFAGKPVPRPKHWGGYLVKPVSVEFWQGRPSRLHDRLLYSKEGDNWNLTRLAP